MDRSSALPLPEQNVLHLVLSTLRLTSPLSYSPQSQLPPPKPPKLFFFLITSAFYQSHEPKSRGHGLLAQNLPYF